MRTKTDQARVDTTGSPVTSRTAATAGRGQRPKPNNYFHVRIYTDAGSKIELYRDKKYPSTRRQIIDGLHHAIELIEKMDAAIAKAEGAQ